MVPGRFGWLLVIGVIYAAHQDLWFWREARPLVFGFLPVGLAYHGAYCVAGALLMWALTRFAWPGDLERGLQPDDGNRRVADNPREGARR